MKKMMFKCPSIIHKTIIEQWFIMSGSLNNEIDAYQSLVSTNRIPTKLVQKFNTRICS